MAITERVSPKTPAEEDRSSADESARLAILARCVFAPQPRNATIRVLHIQNLQIPSPPLFRSSGKMMRPPSQPDLQLENPGVEFHQVLTTEPSQGPENPFVCNVCKKSYSRIDHLARHYRSHTNEKPFVCTVCDKEFGRADLLKRHVAAHGEEKSFRKKQKTTTSTPSRPRVSQACMACAEAKLKCEQNKPCRRCLQKGIECEHPASRSGKPALDSNAASSDVNVSLDSRLEGIHSQRNQDHHILSTQTPPMERTSSITDHQQMPETMQLATPTTFEQDSVPSASMDIDPLMDFDNSSFAEFLRDIMMPMSPAADLRNFGDATLASFTPRDVLNFGVETSYELPALDSSFPLPSFDDPFSFTNTRPDIYLQNSGSGTRTPDVRSAINLGAQAFKESLWQWTPAQEDHGYAEQPNLSLPQGLRVAEAWVAADGPSVPYRLDQTARDRVLAMILSTCEERIFPRVVSSFPPTDLLSSLFHNFVAYHSSLPDPWIHLPTLQPNEVRTELLSIILSFGAVQSGDHAIRSLGFAVQEAARLAIPKIFENDNRATRSLQMLQAYALQLDIGLWSGDRRKMEIAESFSQPLITMLRRAGHFRRPKQNLSPPTSNDDAKTLEMKWRNWVETESFKRLAFHLFIRDGQTSMSLLTPPLISYAEVTAEMPAAKELWSAKNAAEFRDIYLSQGPTFDERIPSLPHCIHDPTPLSRFQDTVDITMSTLIVLYGIWTLIWEYRQLHTIVKLHPTNTHWNSGLITTSLHQEVCQLLRNFNLNASDWTDGLQAEALLVYERSLLNLHVSFEDLQLFAGKDGEDEARRVYPILKLWAENRESRQAVWHAGQVFKAAKDFRQKGLRCFSAIALYHASLTLWAYAVVSSPVRKRKNSSNSRGRLNSFGQTVPPDNTDNTLIWLDGEDGPALQRFLVLNRGIPAIRHWSLEHNNEVSDLRSGDFAPLSSPLEVMEIVIDVLTKKSQGDDRSPPPLVKNLSQLMRSLGSAAKGMRKVM